MALDTTYGTEDGDECAKRAAVVAFGLCFVVVLIIGGGSFWGFVARVFVWASVLTILFVSVFCTGLWARVKAAFLVEEPELAPDEPHMPAQPETAEEAEIASAFAEEPESLSDPHHQPRPAPGPARQVAADTDARILPQDTVSAEIAEMDAQPGGLDGARDGAPDDLKQIKGVGPALEALLHKLGIYHFDQIAGWTAAEVAWMDSNLQGFKGRVTRDNWVEQAQDLARGQGS